MAEHVTRNRDHYTNPIPDGRVVWYQETEGADWIGASVVGHWYDNVGIIYHMIREVGEDGEVHVYRRPHSIREDRPD